MSYCKNIIGFLFLINELPKNVILFYLRILNCIPRIVFVYFHYKRYTFTINIP